MRKKIFTILACAAFCLSCDTEPEKEYVPPCRHPSFWSDYFAEEETLKDFIFYTRSAGENQTFHFAYSSLPEINGYNRDGFSFLGVFDRQGRGHYHAEAYPVSQYEYYDVFCYYGKPSFNPRAEDYLECRFSSFECELNGGFSSKEILWSVVEDTEEMFEVSFAYHEIPIFTATLYGEARNDILIEELSDAILSTVVFVC